MKTNAHVGNAQPGQQTGMGLRIFVRYARCSAFARAPARVDAARSR